MKSFLVTAFVTTEGQDIFEPLAHSFKMNRFFVRAAGITKVRDAVSKSAKSIGLEIAKIQRVEHIVVDCLGNRSIRQTWESQNNY